MAWIKDLTGSIGDLAGTIIKAPLQVAGEIFDSEFLKEVGDGAYKVTKRTGEMLGDVTEGVVDVVSGTVNSDKNRQSAGAWKIADTGIAYGKGVIKGTGNMIKNGTETIGAILNGDTDKAIKTGKEIIKTAAIGMAGIGIADIFGGFDIDDTDAIVEVDDVPDYDIDDIADPDRIQEEYALTHVDDFDEPSDDLELIENENTHYVTPHERELPDGRVIWVDGDGNTAIDRDTGWIQSNPDYRVTK